MQAIATGEGSTAIGFYSEANGNWSTALGWGTIARSAFETVIGRFNTNYGPVSATGWNPADRLFVIGNGTNENSGSSHYHPISLTGSTFNHYLTLTS